MLGITSGRAHAFGRGRAELAAELSPCSRWVGYASARELLRYTLTGAYAFRAARAPIPRGPKDGSLASPAPMPTWSSGAVDTLVDNAIPEQGDHLIDALPEDTRRSRRALPKVESCPGSESAILMQDVEIGRPRSTESLRLDRRARAASQPVRTIIVGALGHVEPGERATVSELVASWAAFYAFRVPAARVPR